MLLGQALYRSERLIRGFHGKIKLAKDLRYQASGRFVWAKE
jgi:hypothetical protein